MVSKEMKMRASHFAAMLATLAVSWWPQSAIAFDEAEKRSIRLYNYNFLDLTSDNAKTVAEATIEALVFCEKLTGETPQARPELAAIADKLSDTSPERTRKASELGRAGNLGSSYGAVPMASIKDIAAIKGVDASDVCHDLDLRMAYEARRYKASCKLTNDKASYVCAKDYTP